MGWGYLTKAGNYYHWSNSISQKSLCGLEVVGFQDGVKIERTNFYCRKCKARLYYYKPEDGLK